MWQAGLLSRCRARVSPCSGFSCCGAWTLGARARVVVGVVDGVAVGVAVGAVAGAVGGAADGAADGAGGGVVVGVVVACRLSCPMACSSTNHVFYKYIKEQLIAEIYHAILCLVILPRARILSPSEVLTVV